jgi:hypothetical protein
VWLNAFVRAFNDRLQAMFEQWRLSHTWPTDVPGWAVMCKDSSTPGDGKQYWDKASRDEYNEGLKMMTPMIHVPIIYGRGGGRSAFGPGCLETTIGLYKPHERTSCRTLWVGCDQAAHDHESLVWNYITMRLSCKGKWSRKKDNRFNDLDPYWIQDLIGGSDYGEPKHAAFDQHSQSWKDLERTMKTVIHALTVDGHNILAFCQQGSRRSAAFVMMFVMCVTRCSPRHAYQYVKFQRATIEDNLLWTAECFDELYDLWSEWCPDYLRMALPAVLGPSEILQLLGPSPWSHLVLKGDFYCEKDAAHATFVLQRINPQKQRAKLREEAKAAKEAKEADQLKKAIEAMNQSSSNE